MWVDCGISPLRLDYCDRHILCRVIDMATDIRPTLRKLPRDELERLAENRVAVAHERADQAVKLLQSAPSLSAPTVSRLIYSAYWILFDAIELLNQRSKIQEEIDRRAPTT